MSSILSFCTKCLLHFGYKQHVLQDIHAALNLWLSIHIPEGCSIDDQHDLMSKNTILLLYNIVDLLSLKVSFVIFLVGIASS